MAKRRRSPLAQGLVAWACIGFAKLTRALPLSVNRILGRGLGRIAYWVVPRIRKVGMANLDLAYGNTISRSEKRRILQGAAANVGIVAAEFSRIPCLRDDFVRSQVTVAGVELFDLERGGLLMSAHLANWEWMGPAFHGYGFRVAEIVRPLAPRRLNALVDGTRRAGLDMTIPKSGAGPEVIRLLREGWIIGVLADQSPRMNGVPVHFFGAPCWATAAPAMLALRAGVPIYGASFTRGARGHYDLQIRTRIEVVRSGDLLQDLTECTQRCQDFLESLVREYPEQWLWLHRRWKPRLRLEREWARRLARSARDK